MRRSLVLILALLVLAPLGLLGWLGARMAADEHARVEADFARLVEGRLRETAAALVRVPQRIERELLAIAGEFPTDPHHVRRLARRSLHFDHVLVLDPQARLAFPPLASVTSQGERDFLKRTSGLWEGGALVSAPRSEAGKTSVQSHGWHIWYWGGGLNLVFWARHRDGRVIAFEVPRVKLLAEVIAGLPESVPDGPQERTALLDSAGGVLYQWGELEPRGAPRHELALAEPLNSWRLAWWGPQPTAQSGLAMSALAALLAVGLALAGLAAWFYRESSRELRLAAQRVSFVNQVSHELKTPLTNIRMYAELLEDELFDADPKSERYLGVIVHESQRLSRLIGNILTFARGQRKKLSLVMGAGSVDEVVREVLESYAAGMAAAKVEVKAELDAPAAVRLDRDALGQMLGNLLGNVEKYAPGAPLTLQTRQEGAQTSVVVHDGGPGVPKAHQKRVFEPFHRVSEGLADAAGTGIGLGIARELARLHGGDLRIEASETGARFVLTLKTEPSPTGA